MKRALISLAVACLALCSTNTVGAETDNAVVGRVETDKLVYQSVSSRIPPIRGIVFVPDTPAITVVYWLENQTEELWTYTDVNKRQLFYKVFDINSKAYDEVASGSLQETGTQYVTSGGTEAFRIICANW